MRALRRKREVGLLVLWHVLYCKLMCSQRRSDAPKPPSFMTGFFAFAFAFLPERKVTAAWPELRQRLDVELLRELVNGE